jgi:hypothetical protein
MNTCSGSNDSRGQMSTNRVYWNLLSINGVILESTLFGLLARAFFFLYSGQKSGFLKLPILHSSRVQFLSQSITVLLQIKHMGQKFHGRGRGLFHHEWLTSIAAASTVVSSTFAFWMYISIKVENKWGDMICFSTKSCKNGSMVYKGWSAFSRILLKAREREGESSQTGCIGADMLLTPSDKTSH